MEDHKISRGHREDADRRISELQREIHKRDIELAEANGRLWRISFNRGGRGSSIAIGG